MIIAVKTLQSSGRRIWAAHKKKEKTWRVVQRYSHGCFYDSCKTICLIWVLSTSRMKISNTSIIFGSHFNTWIIRNIIGGDGNPAPFTLYISTIDYRFKEGFDLVSCCQDGCRAARLAYEDVSWLFSTEICRELCVDLYRSLIQTLNLHDQPWKQTLCLNVKTPFRSLRWSRVLAMWCDVMWCGRVGFRFRVFW